MRASTDRFFAIGTKGYVELRRAKSPPKVHRKVLTKTVRNWERVGYDNDNWGISKWADVEKEVKVPIITFQGGKTLGTMQKAKFARLTGHSLGIGTVWEITKEATEKLLEKL